MCGLVEWLYFRKRYTLTDEETYSCYLQAQDFLPSLSDSTAFSKSGTGAEKPPPPGQTQPSPRMCGDSRACREAHVVPSSNLAQGIDA